MKNSLVKRLSILLIFALIAASCGSDDDTTEADDTTGASSEESAEDLPVVKLSALSGGLTGVALTVIEENNFDEANGFSGEFFYNDPDASGQFFLQRNSDVAFDYDAIGAAIARTEDLDVSVFYPILNNNNCMLVQEGSSYASPEDLIGEKVGHFGADSGTTTSFTIVIQAQFGFNILDDYDLVETGPPALVELLADGEVEAIFDFVPHVSRAMVQVPADCVYGPVHSIVQDLPGGIVSHLSEMAAFNDWLDENPDLALSVMAAWDDAFNWIMEDPIRITQEPYRTLIGQDDQAVLDLFAQQVTDIPLFTNSWSADIQAGVEAWIDLAAEQNVLIEENPGGVVRSLGS